MLSNFLTQMYCDDAKMKKTISVLLCVILLFGLSSCGKKKIEPSDAPKVSLTTNAIEDDNTISADYSYDVTSYDVTSSSAKPNEKVKITIPEGYTLLRLSWLLEDKGLCTSDEFMETAQTAKEWLSLSEYPFLSGAFNTQNVCFYLEGYIFPLTYEIPKGTDAKNIIKIFLNGTKARFTNDFLTKVNNSGYSLHEILTIASIIEKEAKTNEQRPLISSVINNRIKSGMKIQCDPTVNYCTGVIGVYYPEKLDEYKMYYNTYRCSGLMPGPICNPGIASIEAAISPAATDYYYFIIESEAPYNSYFSKTYEEHNAKWNELQNS